MLLGSIGRNGLAGVKDVLSTGGSLGRDLYTNSSAPSRGKSFGSSHRRSQDPHIPECAGFPKFCCTNVVQENYNVYDGPDLNFLTLYDKEEIVQSKGMPKLPSFQEERVGSPKAKATLHGAIGKKADKNPDGLVEKAEMEDEDGNMYKGQWKGDVKHGYGTLTKPTGQIFVGNFENSQAHGHGIWKEKSGITYEGNWKAGLNHGFGKCIYPDGTTYEGEWQGGVKSGQGIEHWPDGGVYQGEFLNGAVHGAGVYRSQAGAEYTGHWSNGRMDGEGTYKFANGRVYKGQWKDGHMTGKGKMKFPCGSQYEGSYEKDVKSGEGTFQWPDGRIYKGQWKDGKQHGEGYTIDLKGKKKAGTWQNGQRVDEIQNRQLADENTPQKNDGLDAPSGEAILKIESKEFTI